MSAEPTPTREDLSVDVGRFGFDAFTRDDRLRLFSFASAQNKSEYLWTLRALEHARANYVVLLHASDVAAAMVVLGEEYGESVDVPRLGTDELTPLLDQLYGWQLLDRSYDGARAATLSEYRNRHYVYQFTQAGHRAYRAVEDVLGARMDDATLSRLVLPELLRDLAALAEANAQGDSEEVYRKLTRLDAALSDMANRAARFYLMLGDLARTNDTSAEVFLRHKDALLEHMREFSTQLTRYAPKLAEAIRDVEATDVDALVARAAEADERVFGTHVERLADWRQRWLGLARWFTADDNRPSETERLQDGTMSAITGVLALLRRVTEARRGGVSRESQLRHLAAWFTAAPDPESAHALFGAAFGLARPRHVSLPHADPELIPASRTWWEAPAAPVSRTLVETGKPAGPGAPAKIERNDAGRRRLREQQQQTQQERYAAARSLAEGVYDRTLGEPETALLLELLSVALAARVPVAGSVSTTAGLPAGSPDGESGSGSVHGVRLILEPSPHSMTVRTVRGDLHLDRLALTVR